MSSLSKPISRWRTRARSGGREAAYLLYPKPPNFRRGIYRFTSAFGGVPTDDDLFATITRGLPGSAMPPWGHLSESDRRALVQYVKSLAETPIVAPDYRAPDVASGTEGQGVIPVPAETPDDADSRNRASQAS